MSEAEVQTAIENMKKTPKAERETVCLFSAQTKLWSVCSDDLRVVKRLLKKGYRPSGLEGVQLKFNDLAEKSISFRNPSGRKKSTMSPEARAARGERIRQAWAKRKAGGKVVAPPAVPAVVSDDDVILD